MTHKDWQTRLITEANELKDRIYSLSGFIGHSRVFQYELSDDDRSVLLDQIDHMEQYLACLKKRIASFDIAASVLL